VGRLSGFLPVGQAESRALIEVSFAAMSVELTIRSSAKFPVG
jgi:hypothetical protein